MDELSGVDAHSNKIEHFPSRSHRDEYWRPLVISLHRMAIHGARRIRAAARHRRSRRRDRASRSNARQRLVSRLDASHGRRGGSEVGGRGPSSPLANSDPAGQRERSCRVTTPLTTEFLLPTAKSSHAVAPSHAAVHAPPARFGKCARPHLATVLRAVRDRARRPTGTVCDAHTFLIESHPPEWHGGYHDDH